MIFMKLCCDSTSWSPANHETFAFHPPNGIIFLIVLSFHVANSESPDRNEASTIGHSHLPHHNFQQLSTDSMVFQAVSAGKVHCKLFFRNRFFDSKIPLEDLWLWKPAIAQSLRSNPPVSLWVHIPEPCKRNTSEQRTGDNVMIWISNWPNIFQVFAWWICPMPHFFCWGVVYSHSNFLF